jgi:alanyl-tRNA synthetase
LLDRGLKLLDEEVASLAEGQALPGAAAFKLYDTFGFPLDLTQDALRREGRTVDVKGFDDAMAAQKATARAAWTGSGDAADEKIWFEIRDEFGATEFLGYLHDVAEGVVQAIIKNGERVSEASKGDEVELVVNQTPFYAESGGQAGDGGDIESERGARLEVRDVKKRGQTLHGHIGKIVNGAISVGDNVRLSIDTTRRARTRSNHSATHLLHKALREVLGDHVTQKGSLVSEDRLRFDFAHPKALTENEIAEIDRRVNAVIRQNGSVETRIMPYDDAVKAGAIALFGEKYADDVRVLSMGEDTEAKAPYSVELCGGTHVRRTGDIALYTTIGEGAVAAGVRRVEALTGEAARLHLAGQSYKLKHAADILKTTPSELDTRLENLVSERKKLERELAEARRQLALGGGGKPAADAFKEIAGVKFVGKVVDGVAAKDLRGLVDQAKQSMGSGVAAFISVNDGKAALAVGVTDDLTDRLSAVELVKAGAEAVGGKGGGGRPDMAQAGGPNGADSQKAIDAIMASIAQ